MNYVQMNVWRKNLPEYINLSRKSCKPNRTMQTRATTGCIRRSRKFNHRKVKCITNIGIFKTK